MKNWIKCSLALSVTLAAAFTLGASPSLAALVEVGTWSAANPNEASRSPPATLVAKGTADDFLYVLQADPVTGLLQVSAGGGGGDATAANQVLGNASLSSIDGKTPAFGQTTMASSSPVTIASNQSALPVTGTFFQATQPVSGTFFQATQPVSGTFFQATQPVSGTVAVTQSTSPWVVDGSGVTQPVSAASLPLPTGASTSALQTTGNSSLSSLDTKLPSQGQAVMAASTPVVIASNQTTLPISAATLPLPTGAATSANQTTANASLSSIDSKLTSPLAVTGTFFQATQPVSAATLPLPSGASTSANQTTANASLSSIDTKTLAAGQAAMAASSPVVIASNQSAILVDGSGVTQPVSAASLPLPTGAATSALQTTGNSSLSSIDGKIANDHGVSSGAVRTVTANVSYSDSVRNAYASTNVTTGAWVQLIASTAATINHLHLFDSCGETLELGTGAAAAETRVFIVPPGGISGVVDLTIAAGTRLSIRAISADCTTGEIDITGLN